MDDSSNKTLAPATRYVQIREEDARSLAALMEEPAIDRGQPTHRDPLLQRYEQAATILNDAIADRG